MIAALNKLAQRLTATPQRAAPYPLIPSELKERAQWVIFALTPPDAKGKRKKKPLDPQTGEWSSTPNGPAIRLSFGDAVQLEQSTPAHFRNRVDGVGYVFTKDDPYSGVDLDDCYHGGKLDDRARAIIESLHSYTEISISGRGVKAIVKATVAVNPSLVRGVEVYGASGFFALTGKHLVGTPRTVNEAGRVVAALIGQFSPAPAHASQNERSAAKAHNERATITDNPIAAYNQAFDVSTIVERCGGKADGRKLYHCPCPAHTGASGSLLMKKSAKYGAVVRGLNPACIFHGRDSAAFDAMRFLEHGGNLTDAIKAARVALAMPIQGEKRPLAFAPKRPAPPAARIVENASAVMSDVLSRAARDEGLKKSERRVLNTLIDHAPDGIARLSVQHVASLTGESESSVQRATRTLNGRYFVKHEDANEYGGNLANVYQFIKILTPPPVNNDEALRSKRDFDTPLTLIESKGGDNGTAFEQIPQIPQSDPNQAEPALAVAPPPFPLPAQPAAVATARPSLHAAVGDAPTELLNIAADLLTDELFGEYETFKAQYPQYEFATDGRHCYKKWRLKQFPALALAAITDSALAGTPMMKQAPPAAAIVDDVPTGEWATFTPMIEPPAQDKLFVASVFQVGPFAATLTDLRKQRNDLYAKLHSISDTVSETDKQKQIKQIMAGVHRVNDVIRKKERAFSNYVPPKAPVAPPAATPTKRGARPKRPPRLKRPPRPKQTAISL